MIVQRCDCRGQCQIVAVERLANAIHQIGDFSRSQRVANTQTSEAVDLREGAGNHQIRELGQPGHRIGTVGQRQILVVGLVENHHDILRHRLQEGFQLRIGQEGTGRVVRIGHPDDACIRTDRGAHGIEVMAEILRRHNDQFSTGGQGCQRVNSKGVLRKYRRPARSKKNTGDQIEDIVRAVAEHDALYAEPGVIGERFFQVKIVGIALQRPGRLFQRRLGLRAHAQWILVGSKLDDLGYRNTHLAGQLGDRLTRQIGRNGTNIGQRLVGKGHGQTSEIQWINKPQRGRNPRPSGTPPAASIRSAPWRPSARRDAHRYQRRTHSPTAYGAPGAIRAGS